MKYNINNRQSSTIRRLIGKFHVPLFYPAVFSHYFAYKDIKRSGKNNHKKKNSSYADGSRRIIEKVKNSNRFGGQQTR